MDPPAATLLQQSLETLMRELVGGPDARAQWILNGGDVGLIRSLDRLTAQAASATSPGGSSIAAHVDHLRYGLSLMNRWSQGAPDPWTGADWARSWTRTAVTEAEWEALRASFASEARAWLESLRRPREYSALELTGVIASLAHLAYHVGAIRQIDRSIAGPPAR